MVNSVHLIYSKPNLKSYIMKTNDLQELKPIYIHEASYSVDDEISLVDLAIVLVRHKKMIAIIITFILTIAVITTFFIPSKYTFSSSLVIGSQLINNELTPFESPDTVLAKLQYNFIQQAISEYKLSNPEDKAKYKITASVPKNSLFVYIETKATEEDTKIITGLLSNISQKIIQDHKYIYDAAKTNISSLRNQAKSELELFGAAKDNQGEKRRLLRSVIEVYESALANLRSTREMSPPIRSIEPIGTSKRLIIAIAAIISIIIAVFAAFFVEFATRVKEKVVNTALTPEPNSLVTPVRASESEKIN